MPNRLINQTSPYLLQHAYNPVNWYPWSQEALDLARIEDKPIFLSIGYAACHWCHVMAHESFEDPVTAELLNHFFINIKVDREERPDLDSIYMNAVVAMTGSGGWPMSIFLTPEGKPFYGGTYFPPTPRYGMPSFQNILNGIIQTWKENRTEIATVSERLLAHLKQNIETRQSANIPFDEVLSQATRIFISSYDHHTGGWGKAPKFPQPMIIDYLLLRSDPLSNQAIDIAIHCLRSMAKGGMYDLVGGGFHRYSTDANWLVPHFEKMLYDNAQLARSYLHAYLISGNSHLLEVCERTLQFIKTELLNPQGGFYSSLDADSEGEEGKYYVWSYEELKSIFPHDSDFQFLQDTFSLSPGGNHQGMNVFQFRDNIYQIITSNSTQFNGLKAQIDHLLERLYTRRSSRIRPATDDKVLMSWNGFALITFSEAARYLHHSEYLQVAQDTARFLLTNMMKDNLLYRSWRNGILSTPAFLEDYSALILGLLSLYQADHDEIWFIRAEELAETMVDLFYEPGDGFYDTQRNQPQLFIRPKDVQDNATPSGSALACLALLSLDSFTIHPDWRSIVERALSGMVDLTGRYPSAFACWLQVFDLFRGPVEQIAIVGDPGLTQTQELLYFVKTQFRPRSFVGFLPAPKHESHIEFLNHRQSKDNKPAVHICKNFVCNLPAFTLAETRDQLKK